MESLRTNIAGLQLDNPVLTASGTFGYGEEFETLTDVNSLGGIIVKGTTLLPRQGNPSPRMAETPSGMLNAVGLQNKGVDYFIENIYPRIARKFSCEIIVNVAGSTVEDYVEVCRRLQPLPRIRAIEVNISCPNVKQGGMAFGTTASGAAEITRAVRNAWDKTLIMKLSPNVTDITEIARAAESEGADAVSLINTLLGMVVDVKRRRACLSTITGGLSGPAVRPVAVRMVWQTAKAVQIPVIGLGGICTADDALQFFMAGAKAIEIGTASFINPNAGADIVDGLKKYIEDNRLTSLQDIIGII
ncbi:MAG: dihydroorotate dehydrogenase [Muribaculaceae bacterium]